MSQRRNAKGAGSLFKDKNGYWTAQLQIGTVIEKSYSAY